MAVREDLLERAVIAFWRGLDEVAPYASASDIHPDCETCEPRVRAAVNAAVEEVLSAD